MTSTMLAVDLHAIAPGLELSAEGWWSSRKVSGVSYPDDGNSLCFLVEDSSFWFEHRNQCILQAIRQFPPPGPVFDVGAETAAWRLRCRGWDTTSF
jgi:hypothetical protein